MYDFKVSDQSVQIISCNSILSLISITPILKLYIDVIDECLACICAAAN